MSILVLASMIMHMCLFALFTCQIRPAIFFILFFINSTSKSYIKWNIYSTCNMWLEDLWKSFWALEGSFLVLCFLPASHLETSACVCHELFICFIQATFWITAGSAIDYFFLVIWLMAWNLLALPLYFLFHAANNINQIYRFLWLFMFWIHSFLHIRRRVPRFRRPMRYRPY